MKDTFSTYHPLINFIYFTQMLLFSMFFMHPICLGISLLCAFTYALDLNKRKTLNFSLKYMLPILLITALLNPAFNHAGGTILTYLPSGNPLTLESIAYGLAAAVMLITVLCWFSCYNAVMTSDKFVYLFGRGIPALSLVLSMVLRFVPRLQAQLQVVSDAQKCLGRDISNGSLLRRAKHGIRILSVIVTWSLENAIETADSMRSRGYGLPGRTAFSIYRFDKRDKNALLFLFFCGSYILLGSVLGGLYWRYFPIMQGVGLDLYPLTLYLAYLALCIVPVVINVEEDWRWVVIHIRSKT